MLIDVQVVPDNEFQAWLEAHRSQPALPAPSARLHLPGGFMQSRAAQKGINQ